MPFYEFECTECGTRSDFEMRMAEVETEMDLPCPCGSDADVATETPHRRILGSFGLGAVRGAGGSPSRFGASRKGDSSSG